jgi:hypothetical protein
VARGDDLDPVEHAVRSRLSPVLEVLVDRVSVSQEGAGPGKRWRVVTEVPLGAC